MPANKVADHPFAISDEFNTDYGNINNNHEPRPNTANFIKPDDQTRHNSTNENQKQPLPEVHTRYAKPDASDKFWGPRISNFAGDVSIVGIRYVFEGNAHLLRRLLWLILVLGGVGFLFYQVVDRVQYFLSYPTTVSVRMRYNNTLRLPTVTICNENLVKKSVTDSFGKCKMI